MPVLFYLSVILIILLIVKELFNFKGQPQEETGSAEEQPASNKADAYTIVRELSNQPLSLLSVCPMA